MPEHKKRKGRKATTLRSFDDEPSLPSSEKQITYLFDTFMRTNESFSRSTYSDREFIDRTNKTITSLSSMTKM